MASDDSRYILYYVLPDSCRLAPLSISVLSDVISAMGQFGSLNKLMIRTTFDRSDLLSNSLRFCVCFYSQDCYFSRAQIHMLEELHKNRIPILPVTGADMVHFLDFLADINFLEVIDDSSETEIISCILSGFGLIREERRIFISYRRKDSSAIAMQLHDELVHRGYTVFLDTASIRHGDVFQKELMHQLVDADVLMLLNSENIAESDWIEQEYLNAMAERIGILHIDWPGVKIPSGLKNIVDMVQPFRLEESHLNGTMLTADALSEITDRVESLRIANLAARRTFMINEFCERIKAEDDSLTAEYSIYDNLIEVLGDGRCLRYYPITGIPKSSVFDKVRKDFSLQSCSDDTSLRILYNEMLIRDEYIQYLDWVDKNTPIHLEGFNGYRK